MIRAVSFDFWNTFAIPNKDYAEARTHYLENFDISKEDYKKVKLHLDSYAETDGLAVTPQIALSMLFPKHKNLTISLADVEQSLIGLFKKYPPKISDEVQESLNILVADGIEWGITSNTNFISGKVLSEFIYGNITNKQAYGLVSEEYSDIRRHSKPSPYMFSKVQNNFLLEGREILHIGDHPICDYAGALKYGFQAKLIETSQDILNCVKEINND